jgi:hypothetical protein
MDLLGRCWRRVVAVSFRLSPGSETSTAFSRGWNRLFAAMASKFHAVYDAASQAMQDTPRSSSLVENLNSARAPV